MAAGGAIVASGPAPIHEAHSPADRGDSPYGRAGFRLWTLRPTNVTC